MATNTLFNSGVPVSVDVASIERELRSLWKSASDQKGMGAVIRACSCNLIVFAGTPDEAEHLLQVADRVAEHHPCRTLITWAGEGTDMQAWISARCSVPVSGGPQVCSEVILLGTATQKGEAAANTLVSLLVPDLPVYLYFPVFASSSLELVTRLAPWGTILIMDSRTRGSSAIPGSYLLEFMQHPPSAISPRDLEWARITPWRDLVAQFFDGPDQAQLAAGIAAVEIRASSAVDGEIPTAALYLAGWLAAGLGWSAGAGKKDAGQLTLPLRAGAAEASLSIQVTPSEDGQEPSLHSIRLKQRHGHSLSVHMDGPTGCLVAESGTEARAARSVPYTDPAEAELLVAELAYSGLDIGYQKALEQAIRIARSVVG